MEKEQLKQLLKQLHEAMQHTKTADKELLNLFSRLDNDIHQLLEKNHHDKDTLVELSEKSVALSAQFAAQNPRLESALRELSDMLIRMGI